MKTQTVEIVKEIGIILKPNWVTVKKLLGKYPTGGLNILLQPKKNLGGKLS